MNIDGEWRTAFIADEAPDLPLRHRAGAGRRRQSRPLRRRLHDRQHRRHPEARRAPGAGLGAAQVPRHRRRRRMVLLSNGLRNVPTTESSAKSPDLKPDPKFDTFMKIFANQNTTTTPVTAAGSAYQELFNELRQQVAGRPRRRPAGRPRGSRQADRRPARQRPGRTGPVSVGAAGGRRRSQATRRRAAWRRRRTVLAFMSPWIVGFSVFFALSAGRDGLPLVHPLRPAPAVALDRARQLQVHVHAATSRSGRRSTTRSGSWRSWCR